MVQINAKINEKSQIQLLSKNFVCLVDSQLCHSLDFKVDIIEGLPLWFQKKEGNSVVLTC